MRRLALLCKVFRMTVSPPKQNLRTPFFGTVPFTVPKMFLVKKLHFFLEIVIFIRFIINSRFREFFKISDYLFLFFYFIINYLENLKNCKKKCNTISSHYIATPLICLSFLVRWRTLPIFSVKYKLWVIIYNLWKSKIF